MLLLLDNNVFRALIHRNSGGNLERFLEDVRASPFVEPGCEMSFLLTPFSLLEAIGIVPPPALLALNQVQPIQGNESEATEAMTDDMLRQACEFFECCTEISEANLKSKVSEQRNYTQDASLSFFDLCVTKVLEKPETRRHIIACLAVDAVFKYSYPHEQLPHFHVRFLAMLFSRDEVDNSASLFRVIKRIWDVLFNKMYSDLESYNLQRLEQARQCMAIENQHDFLDCDLIHFLCVGYIVRDRRLPVIAFTMDNFDTVCTRISVFKAIQEAFRSKALEILKQKEEDVVMHEQGILVSCNSNAQLVHWIRVQDIQPIDSVS